MQDPANAKKVVSGLVDMLKVPLQNLQVLIHNLQPKNHLCCIQLNDCHPDL
mgnify:CR=1 FL=1